MQEYTLNIRIAFDANDFGFQLAGKERYSIPKSAGSIVIWLGECVSDAQDVGAEVVRYASQYTVRDAHSESVHEVPKSPCIDCGPNVLGPV